ncbi:MAG: VanW family protein [Oscillospiraceae bacterium]|jgi:vancomycin resistance protein YoaR|nr:VanW family protein [Oscillospiraceae bacterium]
MTDTHSGVLPRRVQPRVAAKPRAWWAGPLCLILVGALAALAMWAQRQVKAYEAFQYMRSVVARSTFYDGITVDGVPLGGMTLEQAMERLAARDQQENESFEIFLTAGDARWRISSDEVALHRNTETLIRQAYTRGRTGTLEERYDEINAIAANGVAYESQMWYERSAVRELTDQVARRLTIEGHDAGVAEFNFNTRQFTFTDALAGQIVDADALFNQVTTALDSGNYGATIEVSITHVEPSITREQVQAMYGKVAGFTTSTSANENRNTNISLAARAINGTVLQPGDVFSFNDTTGQRTYAKGYREAGAIQNGVLVDDIGGGVCQVSTTLFNALVRSGLSISMRNPHAWPVDYVNRGEDAMVNWPDKDMRMKNTTDGPIYIIGSFANRTLTFEVYGRKLGDGITIDLYSQTTSTTPPAETVYTRNSSLAPGTEAVTRQGRTGYQVTTYKVTYQYGKEISREAFYKSEYRMYSKMVEYN